MGFTYDLSTDLGEVRFHIGDTDSSAPMFEDAELTAILTLYGNDVEQAVVSCLRNLLAKLSKPDFRADWLQVSHGQARQGITKLLSEKQAEFGISSVGGGVRRFQRADSNEIEEQET